MALDVDTPEYNKRIIERSRVQTKVMKLLADYSLDAILFPHQKQLVCFVGKSQDERNGVLGSVTGFPSISMPGGFSKPTASAPIGVPVGLEILGRPWSEPVLIEIAYSFEKAAKFRKVPVSTPQI
jgi:Asp-tRNA(Asn)/Glu-tRNA(Gln) amidotransferase A subunit family amidase